MSYGHAGRTLALIRRLEAEARQLSGNQVRPGQEQLPEPAGPGGSTITPQSPGPLPAQSRQPFSHQQRRMTGVSQCFPAHAARS